MSYFSIKEKPIIKTNNQVLSIQFFLFVFSELFFAEGKKCG